MSLKRLERVFEPIFIAKRGFKRRFEGANYVFPYIEICKLDEKKPRHGAKNDLGEYKVVKYGFRMEMIRRGKAYLDFGKRLMNSSAISLRVHQRTPSNLLIWSISF